MQVIRVVSPPTTGDTVESEKFAGVLSQKGHNRCVDKKVLLLFDRGQTKNKILCGVKLRAGGKL
jgi:hypothetical protein